MFSNENKYVQILEKLEISYSGGLYHFQFN